MWMKFFHHNSFRGMHGDKIQEALQVQLEWLHTFSELFKEVHWLEADLVKRTPVKVHTNAISAQPEKDKDQSWLEEKLTKWKVAWKVK